MQSAPLTEHATKEEKVQALTQYDQRWELHGEHKPTEGGGRVPGLIWLRRGTQYTWHARGRQEGDLPPVVIEITFFFFPAPISAIYCASLNVRGPASLLWLTRTSNISGTCFGVTMTDSFFAIVRFCLTWIQARSNIRVPWTTSSTGELRAVTATTGIKSINISAWWHG